MTFFVKLGQEVPFGGRLSENNRWVQLSYLIPWRRVEEEYSQYFSKDPRGGRAVSVRMALGALIIQEREGFSDCHLVQHITENPYLQYFLGLEGYREEPPFDPSLLTYFRKRGTVGHQPSERVDRASGSSRRRGRP